MKVGTIKVIYGVYTRRSDTPENLVMRRDYYMQRQPAAIFLRVAIREVLEVTDNMYVVPSFDVVEEEPDTTILHVDSIVSKLHFCRHWDVKVEDKLCGLPIWQAI